MTRQDIDLQKIQILESSYQGLFNFMVSFASGIIVGTAILIATVYYARVFDVVGLSLSYALVLAIGLYIVRVVKKDHEEHISFMNGLMLRIEKGEKLESIEELRETHKKKS